MNALGRLFARQPVLLGKALLATIDLIVLASGVGDVMKAAVSLVALAWVGWGEALLSTPTVKAEAATDAAHQAGYNAAVADVSALQPKIPPPPIPQPDD